MKIRFNKIKIKFPKIKIFGKEVKKKKKEESELEWSSERWYRGKNYKSLIMKVIRVLLALYIFNAFTDIALKTVDNQTSPFFEGLRLIGWNVTNGTVSAVGSTGFGGFIMGFVMIWIMFELIRFFLFERRLI